MMAHRFRLAVLVLLTALGLALPARAAFETRARAAWVYDLTNETVLLSQEADVPIPPASMSKLMTLNMLFEALKDGRVTLETPFTVSERAQAMGGSTMFLDTTDRPTVESLIKGIIVQSGNDACVVVAENLAGTEEAFAKLMTERGKALGLTNSNFANASGWPNPNHRMSMHDLGRVAVRLITEFPEYYGYFGIEEFGYDGRAPDNSNNRNPLLGRIPGADGLKTGHTAEAGYGLVGSVKQGDRRIVFVLSGLSSEAERGEEAERVANWAFRQFVERTVANKGTRIPEAEVWMGQERRVGLVPAEDIRLLLPAIVQGELQAEVVYQGPILAPISAGQKLAELVVEVEGMEPRHLPLVAEADVPQGGFLTRLTTAARALLARYAATN